MSKVVTRLLAGFVPLVLLAAACSADDSGGGGGDGASDASVVDTEDIDYEAIGLWDDGPCDETMDPLKVGLMTVFQSPVVSLEDQAIALEVAADAFNRRGGANGACIEVTTCDDGSNVDQAVACVDEMVDAGVVATVNDQGTAGQAEVSEAMAAAQIPRVASNVASDDWGDQNAFPLDPSGTGGTFVHPEALLQNGVTKIAIIRVDLAAASALIGLLGDTYPEADFVADIPVPGGTTDYSQFILAAQDAGAEGVQLSIGEQEAVQVIRAAEQLGSDLEISVGLGTVSYDAMADLGDIAEQMVMTNGFAPATADLPIYDALRSDLSATGEEQLQPGSLRASPMRSWIGLYALLYMIRDAGMTEFTGPAIRTMLEAAQDVPMLGMYGDADWTPDTDHPGIYARAGIDRLGVFAWDPEADNPVGLEGNFVETGEISFDGVLCGSPFGAPAAEC
jgi:ABC-type branched-subunit amino acid transport system substrate-binding protein